MGNGSGTHFGCLSYIRRWEGEVMANNEQIERAQELYRQGMKLVDIAAELGRPEGTIRRWKSTYGWDNERSENKSERSDKKSERSVRKKTSQEKPVEEEIKLAAENGDLTDKQRLFCILYVKSFNATKAYQKAYGCDYQTAMANGSRMLRNAKVKDEILSLKQNRMNRELLSEEDIFQKYMDIAFADVTDFVEIKDGYATVLDGDAIDGTIVNEVKMGKFGATLKLNDRMQALKWLSEHLDQATEEQKKKLEDLL